MRSKKESMMGNSLHPLLGLGLFICFAPDI